MAELKRRRGRIHIRLAANEREALITVVDELTPHVRAAGANRPLRAYEDPEHQAEYDRWMRPEVEAGRDSDIETIRQDLASGEDLIMLGETQAYSWLRGLNPLRLAAGVLAGADTDGWEERITDQEDLPAEFRMFLLLGYVQEELVAVLSS